MKKLILLMLVVMVPFLTYSQKRTKKGTDKTETKDKSSNEKSNFMIIKGVEVDMTQEGMDEAEIQAGDVSLDQLMKKHIKPVSRFYFSYDVGSLRNEEVQKLIESSKKFRSMAQAVNASAEYGWEFENATVVIDGAVKIHYYFMKR
ncbi:MAG: hypothetical protein HN427_01885 [Flavobacteriales bacterium]|jgi:hypothetical protein|nr:hypothetical protein [Flavobacteriales bacterium]MBT6013709.1 hypothetical protein [Flavobacteriales bacterium]